MGGPTLQEFVNKVAVNTASSAGLASGPGLAAYTAGKHAVVAVSETLYHDLKLAGAKIGVLVLCPSFVRTRINEAERNRPAELRRVAPDRSLDPLFAGVAQQLQAAWAAAMPAEQVTDCVFAVIRANRFYVLSHPEVKGLVRSRLTAILQDRHPA